MLELWAMILAALLAISWYPCGCSTVDSWCPRCNIGTAPTTMSVVLAGFGNDNCDCSALNGTFGLARQGTACMWRYTGTTDCSPGSTASITITAQMVYSTATLGYWYVLVEYVKNGTATYTNTVFQNTTITTPTDCSATVTVANYTSYGSTPEACDGSSATCQINP